MCTTLLFPHRPLAAGVLVGCWWGMIITQGGYFCSSPCSCWPSALHADILGGGVPLPPLFVGWVWDLGRFWGASNCKSPRVPLFPKCEDGRSGLCSDWGGGVVVGLTASHAGAVSWWQLWPTGLLCAVVWLLLQGTTTAGAALSGLCV